MFCKQLAKFAQRRASSFVRFVSAGAAPAAEAVPSPVAAKEEHPIPIDLRSFINGMFFYE
jgi:hypothetical protein